MKSIEGERLFVVEIFHNATMQIPVADGEDTPDQNEVSRQRAVRPLRGHLEQVEPVFIAKSPLEEVFQEGDDIQQRTDCLKMKGGRRIADIGKAKRCTES